MQDILGYYAQITCLFIAVFFALSAGNGILNQYLRYIDRFRIHREDVWALVRNASISVGFLALAYLFKLLSFWIVLVFISSLALLTNVVRINRLINRMDKQ